MTISLGVAQELLDFGARIGPGAHAKGQLEGAVAIHNLLQKNRIAYLADDVGMGKTYVALGALALFRHYQPNFRVLVIAPRKNIQEKWTKELRNFVAHNVRLVDTPIRKLDGSPARNIRTCENLLGLVDTVADDPDQDFFVRLSSFSLGMPIAEDGSFGRAGEKLRAGLKRALPWLQDSALSGEGKREFKDNVARAVCCSLPEFDLVIVDEAHNLKHGFGEAVAARNRVLALAFGRPDPAADPHLFRGYGPRAKRVLFLSATPVEDSYLHLWNQLDIFDKAGPYSALRDQNADEEERKQAARKFLIRRVTSIRVRDQELTKNQYRREWQQGGVFEHDEPISVEDSKQRLVVALVQKKVSELLGHERFNSSFQVGMLASFESFLETAKLARQDNSESNFDGTDQARNWEEREGIDVFDINRLSKDYRDEFGAELPHPKMDAIVESLSDAWREGRKALVFVRRVASVGELKRKLDENYDLWLKQRLREELPEAWLELKEMWEQYEAETKRSSAPQVTAAPAVGDYDEEGTYSDDDSPLDETDSGGTDTFFSWFFRGRGPAGVISGANIQQRFISQSSAYATFFDDNYVAALLGCSPERVMQELAARLSTQEFVLRRSLRVRAKRYLTRAKRVTRSERFIAFQAAAFELLKESRNPLRDDAQIIWQERFEHELEHDHADEAPEVGDSLLTPTFFTRIRERPALRAEIWPEPSWDDFKKRFRERELRRELLATAARLGHAFIDLYVSAIRRIGTIKAGSHEQQDPDNIKAAVSRIDDYLNVLDAQRTASLSRRGWRAFDELQEISKNFALIIDANEPDVLSQSLERVPTMFGTLLRQQQPVGGMSGRVNETLVRQFRMPGYPFVLITTDILQEGEDLHTFCSDVFHYGIAWTPSSMEQRTGRIDRVKSQTERRLTQLGTLPVPDEDKLQVYYPHLKDTVEVLQVDRVLKRMSQFLKLMHQELIVPKGGEAKIDIRQAILTSGVINVPVDEPLQSAFPVLPEHLR